MTLPERIHADMIAALKAREELRLSTLRMAIAALKNREVEKRAALTETEVQQVLATLIKQREDAAAQFAAGGRPELAEKERAEIVIIDAYLPRALSAADIEAAVRAAIAATGALGAKDVGKVMKAAMAQFQTAQQRVDGKSVSEIARRLLGA